MTTPTDFQVSQPKAQQLRHKALSTSFNFASYSYRRITWSLRKAIEWLKSHAQENMFVFSDSEDMVAPILHKRCCNHAHFAFRPTFPIFPS